MLRASAMSSPSSSEDEGGSSVAAGEPALSTPLEHMLEGLDLDDSTPEWVTFMIPRLNYRRAIATIGVPPAERASRRQLEIRIGALRKILEDRIQNREGNRIVWKNYLCQLANAKTVLLDNPSVNECEYGIDEIVWVKVNKKFMYWPGTVVTNDGSDVEEDEVEKLKIRFFGQWENEYWVGDSSDVLPFVRGWNAAQAEGDFGRLDSDMVALRKEVIKASVYQYMIDMGRKPVEHRPTEERWERFMDRALYELKTIDEVVTHLDRIVEKSVLREVMKDVATAMREEEERNTSKRKSVPNSDVPSSQSSKRQKTNETEHGNTKRGSKGKERAVDQEENPGSGDDSGHRGGASGARSHRRQASTQQDTATVHSNNTDSAHSETVVVSTKRLLRDRKVVVDSRGKSVVVKETPLQLQLWEAVKNCNLEETRRLIEQANTDSTDDIYRDRETRQTLLHLAVTHNNLELVKLVVDLMTVQNGNSGRDFSVDKFQDKWGKTALHVAVEKHAVSVLPFLLTHVEDPNEKDNEGSTCLHFVPPAPDHPRGVPKNLGIRLLTARILLEWNSPPNQVELQVEDEDIEHPIIVREDISTAEALRLKIHPGRRPEEGVKRLDVNKGDKSDRTPLFWAVTGNYLELAAYLVRQGCWLSQMDLEDMARNIVGSQETHPIPVQKVLDAAEKLVLPKFVYSNKSIGNVRDPSYKGCKCQEECSEDCGCVKKNESIPPYLESGKVNSLLTSSNIYECGPACKCSCSSEDSMMTSQRGAVEGLSVCHDPLKGFGLQTDVELEKNTIVCTHTGYILTEEELAERQNDPTLGYFEGKRYLMKFVEKGKTWAIDPSVLGNVARLVNHSCNNPNMKLVKIYNGCVYPTIAFMTTKHIPADTELTISYTDTIAHEHTACHCKEQSCKGLLPS